MDYILSRGKLDISVCFAFVWYVNTTSEQRDWLNLTRGRNNEVFLSLPGYRKVHEREGLSR